MNFETKLSALNQLYDIYNDFIKSWNFCCRRFCDSCCTRNVTTTTLEGIYAIERIDAINRKTLFEALKQKESQKRFIPKMSINQFAEICKTGGLPPEEEIDPDWGPCPILKKNECPVYMVRPFGCRCLVSEIQCQETGFAQIDPFIVTVNNIFQQYIEYLDSPGLTGNLTDIVMYFESGERRQNYKKNIVVSGANLILNFPMTCLMIPPEHRRQVAPILESIHAIR